MPPKKSGDSTLKKAQKKIGKVMHEYKHGELHSGSKKGPKVKNPKQAIAIALSEARRSGAAVPPRKGASKKAAPKKSASSAGKKAGTKKKASGKTTAKKTAASKRAGKKTASKRSRKTTATKKR